MIEIDGKLFRLDHISAIVPAGSDEYTNIVTLGGDWIVVRESFLGVKGLLAHAGVKF